MLGRRDISTGIAMIFFFGGHLFRDRQQPTRFGGGGGSRQKFAVTPDSVGGGGSGRIFSVSALQQSVE